jgi:hypothetical protein
MDKNVEKIRGVEIAASIYAADFSKLGTQLLRRVS